MAGQTPEWRRNFNEMRYLRCPNSGTAGQMSGCHPAFVRRRAHRNDIVRRLHDMGRSAFRIVRKHIRWTAGMVIASSISKRGVFMRLKNIYRTFILILTMVLGTSGAFAQGKGHGGGGDKHGGDQGNHGNGGGNLGGWQGNGGGENRGNGGWKHQEQQQQRQQVWQGGQGNGNGRWEGGAGAG